MSKFRLYLETLVLVVIAAPFAGGVLLVTVPFQESFWSVLVAGLGVTVTLLVAAFRYRKIARMLHQNYQWYRKEHPSCAQGKTPLCRACGASAIRARGLMQRISMREHFCGVCGEVLYFSPEAK